MKCVSYACGIEKGGDQRGKNRNKEKINRRVREELQHTGPARLSRIQKKLACPTFASRECTRKSSHSNSYFIREHPNVQYENVHDLTMTKKHK